MSYINGAPTETDPLLPSQSDDSEASQFLTGRKGSIVDAFAAAGGTEGWAEEAAPLSRQTPTEGRQKQFEGMPEVRKKMVYILPALAIGIFLAAADQTIIVSSYGQIGSELNALSETSWIATAYFLTLTSLQPLYGKMSDIFSRKSCLLFAYVVFGLGCLFCGLAKDINQLIAARAFAGIGGGGMATVVSILMSDIIPLKERGAWQGYLNIIYATGASAGAPLGGILADGIGWRWAFLAQAPLCLVAFVAVFLLLHMPAEEGNPNWKAKLGRIDFVGAAVLVAAVFALLLGLDRGSNLAWASVVCLVPLCLSFPLFALFVYVELKVASEPFAPCHIIFKPSLFACYLCNFFSFAGWLAALFYIPLHYQAVHGYTATQAGLLLIPSIVGGVSGSLFGGFYMQWTGKYYWITVISYMSLIVGTTMVLLFSGVVTSSIVGMVFGTVICGFTNGIGVTTTLIALIANAQSSDQAIATACSYLFRSLGSTVGLSLTSTVFNQTLKTSLLARLTHQNPNNSNDDVAKIIEGVRSNLKFLAGLNPKVQEVVRGCYGVATEAAFAFDIVVVVGAGVSAWFLREKALGA